MDLENCIQVQSLIVKKDGSRALYLGTEFNSKEEWIQRIVSRLQSLIIKKDGSRELYIGTEFNSKEEWIQRIVSRYRV